MFAVDSKIVSEISSYMHLHTSCLKSVFSLFPEEEHDLPKIPSEPFKTPEIIDIPFLLDVIPLLKKCHLEINTFPLLKNIPPAGTCLGFILFSIFQFSRFTILIDFFHTPFLLSFFFPTISNHH